MISRSGNKQNPFGQSPLAQLVVLEKIYDDENRTREEKKLSIKPKFHVVHEPSVVPCSLLCPFCLVSVASSAASSTHAPSHFLLIAPRPLSRHIELSSYIEQAINIKYRNVMESSIGSLFTPQYLVSQRDCKVGLSCSGNL